MKVKASLHLHSHEDIGDSQLVDYSLFELIDRLAALGFKVAASTCHDQGVCQSEHIAYAKQKGLLLIPGVEIEIDGRRHLLILNGGPDAEAVATFDELKIFRVTHPEAFVIAPHPNHGKSSTLTLKRIRRYRDLIDAVEHSWFYSSFWNPNLKTERLCVELRLPFIATSDAHTMDYIDVDFAVIDTDDLTIESVFRAIRSGKFENFTRPKKFSQLAGFMALMYYVKIRERLGFKSN